MGNLEAQTAPLIARWDTFLSKLEGTMQGTLVDAEPALLELVVDPDGGVVPFLQSVSALRTQVLQMMNRVDPTWREKVRPLLQEADPDQESWDELDESRKGSDLSDRSSEVFERWETVVAGKAAELVYAKMIEGARTTFRCTLCSADMEITENLFRAHYETCPYCSGQNTYEPSTELRSVHHFTADHLARYRALDAHDALMAQHARCSAERSPVGDEFIAALREAHMTYYTLLLRERIKVVPEYESTFDADLGRYVKEFELKEKQLKGLPISDTWNP